MKLKIEVDINRFKKDFIRLLAHVETATTLGMDAAMAVFKDDCLNKVPKCPVRSGRLSRSHEILSTQVQKSRVIGRMIVRTPYAASIHEGISRYGTEYVYRHAPEEGSHWGQSKLLAYGDKYISIACNTIWSKVI